MSCLTSAQVAAIRAEIVTLDAQIAAIEPAYILSLTHSEVEFYEFDSGDARQRAKRRSPKELRVEMEELKASRNRLQRKLAGTSNVSMNLRRRARSGYGGGYGY